MNFSAGASYPDSLNGVGGYPGFGAPGLPGGVHSTTELQHPAAAHLAAAHLPHSTHAEANNHLPKSDASDVH